MKRVRTVCLALITFLLAVGCDSDPAPYDVNLPSTDGPSTDGPGQDGPGQDGPGHDTHGDLPIAPNEGGLDAPQDLTGGKKLIGQGCCKSGVAGCTLGTCASGLFCHIISGGPYIDRGICSRACSPTVPAYQICKCAPTTPSHLCPGGTPVCYNGTCMWHCLPGSQGCDSSQPCKCQPPMKCLSVAGQGFCLP